MGKLDGRCLCGAITYSCAADPLFTAVCHCHNCQRQTGTSFSIVVGVPEDALVVEGDTLGRFATVGESHGKPTERRFCTACGSPIVTLSEALSGVAIVKAGTLDDTTWLEPQIEIWGDSAQPWVTEHDTRPRLPTGPPARA